MNQVARAGPTPSVSNVNANRVPTSARSVASFEPSAVDELSAQIGVSYEQSEFVFQEYGSEQEQNGQRRPPLGTQGLIRTSNDSFTTLLELVAPVSDFDAVYADNRQLSGSVTVGRAINTYETNARVVSGVHTNRGGSMNFAL